MHVEHKFEEKHLSERKIEKKLKFKIFLFIPTYKKTILWQISKFLGFFEPA